MRPLPGAPGVAAAVVLLLLLLPRARADEHEHTVRVPGRRHSPSARILSSLPGQAQRGLQGPEAQ